MDVRNCRQCGRLFNYLGGPPICQACREAVEEKFQQVKEYVRNNPGSNIQMVAEDNDVTVQQIRISGSVKNAWSFHQTHRWESNVSAVVLLFVPDVL